MKIRNHEEEIARFTHSKDGIAVWYKCKLNAQWAKTLMPLWKETCIYIVDNEYAELRMKSIDTCRPIQVYNPISMEWETPTHKLKFDSNPERYRVKPERYGFEYPVYKRNTFNGFVVEFTGKTRGVIVKDTEESRRVDRNIGCKSDSWLPHTDTEIWEDCDYEEPKEDKFKYPIYKKDACSSLIVKFTGFNEGVVVQAENTSIHSLGHTSDAWIPHTDTNAWEDCDYVEPTYYYLWEKLTRNGSILTSSHITDKYAEKHNFENSGWRKIESSKRTWEDR